MIEPTKTKKEVLYDMKKQLSILGAVALAASMTVTAVADDGTIVAPTYENVCNASWPLSRPAAEICAEQNIYVPLTAAQANDARDIAGLPHEDYTLTVNGSTVDTAAKTVIIAK